MYLLQREGSFVPTQPWSAGGDLCRSANDVPVLIDTFEPHVSLVDRRLHFYLVLEHTLGLLNIQADIISR